MILLLQDQKRKLTLPSLQTLQRQAQKKRKLLVEDYFALKGDSVKIKGEQIWKIIGKIDSADNAVTISYVKNHLNSYNGLFELFYLKSKLPKDTLRKMYDNINPEFKKTRFALRIANYLKVATF